MVGRAAAPLGRLEHQRQLLAHPLLADHLVQGPGSQRRLDRALVAVGLGRRAPRTRDRSSSLISRPCVRSVVELDLRPSTACAGRRATASATAGSSTASRGHGIDGAPSASRGRPAEPEQPARDLVAPGSLAGVPSRHGPGAAPGRRADPVLELEDDPLGALRPMPGTLHQRDEVLGDDGPAQLVGPVHGQHRLRQLGPDPAGRLQQLEHAALVVVGETEQGQRVLAHDHRGRQVGLLADPQRRPASPACTSPGCRPRRPRHGRVDEHARRPGLVTNAIIGAPCLRPARRSARRRCRRLPAGAAAPDVTHRQRERVGGVGRRRSLGELEQPGHHRRDLGLVGPAAAGDRRLDLARCVQRDRDARAARPRRTATPAA